MPSLTPLHETYCKFDRSPPSQADFLEGLAQLATSGITGITDIVQTVHREILLKPFGLSREQTRIVWNKGISRRIYGVTQHIMRQYGKGLAISLRELNSRFPVLHNKPLSPAMHFMVGAINGVLGDYMLRTHNPMALPMVLYDRYAQLQHGEVSGRVIIFAHGLCMNHLSWDPGKNSGMGEQIAYHDKEASVMYLSYNTGRRISSNGRTFANVLQDMVNKNPLITSIDLVGHSMGGLVSRSALFYGKQNGYSWVNMVENLVCLGSPHHGAVLERLGFILQDRLGSIPFANVIAELANMRSSGILDLRYGSVRDDDWEHLEGRMGQMDDMRKPAPLPSRIKTFLVAGTLESSRSSSKALEAIGDYLVSVKSALGEHPHPQFRLKVPDERKAIFYGLNHFEIQYHERVREQVVAWLYPNSLQAQTLSKHMDKVNDGELQNISTQQAIEQALAHTD